MGRANLDISDVERLRERQLNSATRLAAAQAAYERDSRALDDAYSTLILREMRALGLFDLPSKELTDRLPRLVDADWPAARTASCPNDPPVTEEPTLARRRTARNDTDSGPRPHVDRRPPVFITEVIVNVSNNVSAENRAFLREHNMRWNGRRGFWVGPNITSFDALKERFGDRVQTTERGDESGKRIRRDRRHAKAQPGAQSQ